MRKALQPCSYLVRTRRRYFPALLLIIRLDLTLVLCFYFLLMLEPPIKTDLRSLEFTSMDLILGFTAIVADLATVQKMSNQSNWHYSTNLTYALV